MTEKPLPTERGAVIVVGLGYGDEAKGATVDALASHIGDTVAVARWSGGPQAAHNVVHGPRHHTFRQFGSATLQNVRTILMDTMLVDPLMLDVEAHHLSDLGIVNPLNLVTVDPRCLVVTPIHAALNRAREEGRGKAAHGTCGLGIGETVAYAIACEHRAEAGDIIGNFTSPSDIEKDAEPLRFGDLADKAVTLRKLFQLARYAEPLTGQQFDRIATLADDLCGIAALVTVADTHAEVLGALEVGTVIFEGSQGVLLDEHAGFHPHTTWTTTTPARLDSFLRSHGHDPFVLGLTRSYSTRHGAGPMPTETAEVNVPEPHNRDDGAQGAWRQGHLDLTALRYAIAASGGVDGVAVSHLDQMPAHAAVWKMGADQLMQKIGLLYSMDRVRTVLAQQARASRIALASTDDLLHRIAAVADAPVVLTAHGPARTDRMFL